MASGIPNIFRVWKEQKWSEPVITEEYNPDRMTLSLPTIKSDDKKVTIKGDDKQPRSKTSVQKDLIIEYLTDNVSGTISEFSDLLGVKSTRAKKIVYELIAEDIIVAEGANRNRRYKLKS